MELFAQLRISRLICQYPPGTRVSVFDVANVPDGTIGTVEFVDELGFVFIETPGVLPNLALAPADEHVRFRKEQPI